jgi:hypothetical protein
MLTKEQAITQLEHAAKAFSRHVSALDTQRELRRAALLYALAVSCERAMQAARELSEP